MAGRRWVVLLSVLMLASPLVGCLGGTSPDAGEPVSPSGEDEREEYSEDRNTFLIGDVNPASTTVSQGAEPIVFVDQDGEYVLIADTSGVYKSTNGGHSWEDVSPFFTPGVVVDGVTLAQDAAGTLYASNTQGQVIDVAISEDDAESWSVVNTIADVAPIADRPWLAASEEDRVALVINDQGRTFSEYCLTSTDGAQTFTDRQANPVETLPNAGNLIFDEDNDLYWAVDNTIYRRSSQIVEGQSLTCISPAASENLLGGIGPQIFTKVVTDGRHEWIAAPSPDSSKIKIAGTNDLRSDRDLTLTPTDGDQALATNTFLTVSAVPGEVGVAWYGTQTEGDPRDTSFGGEWNVFTATIENPWDRTTRDLTCSSDGVNCTRITDEPNHVGDFCMGGTTCSTGEGDRDLLDYFGIDHGPEGQLHVAYGHDGRSDNGEVRHACVGDACLGANENLPPIADFTFNCGSRSCSFDASDTENPDGTESDLTYNWSFGDGETGQGQQVDHVYDTAGTYDVTLTVVDGNVSDNVTKTVRLFPPVEFTLEPAKDTFERGEPVRLHVNATHGDTGEPLSDLPVRVGTVLKAGDRTVDNLLSAQIAKNALQDNQVVYHEAEGTTDANGHVKLVLSCQGQDEATCLDGASDGPVDGPLEFDAKAESPIEDIFDIARANYNVAVSP